MSETIRQVPISKLVESNDNPRKLFGNLADFSKTLKGGILQPLVAREVGDKLEIVIGHRRFRGAKLAGLKEVPVIVREYTRQQALEAMVIENVHREDVNPMELADSFAQMRQDFGLTGDQIGERVRMKRTDVYDLLNIHDNLLEPTKKALLGDKVSLANAIDLARVRGERLQNAALADALKLAKPGEKPPVRAVRKLIQDRYMSARRPSKKQRGAREHGEEVAIRRRVVQRLLVRVAELVERRAHLDETDMRTMALAATEGPPTQETTREVFERRGLGPSKLAKVGATQLRSLVVELAIAAFVALEGGEYSAGTKTVARAYGVSLAELEKSVEAEAKAEALFAKPGT